MSTVPRVCPSSCTLGCRFYWIPTSVSAEGTSHSQDRLDASVCALLVLSASLVLCVCVRENESYLAVEHLITCHVIQLHSVQVISTEHTTQQISLYHYFPLIHFRIKLTNKCASCVSLCECMSCVAQNSSLLHKCLNESTHVVVVVVCCLRKKKMLSAQHFSHLVVFLWVKSVSSQTGKSHRIQTVWNVSFKLGLMLLFICVIPKTSEWISWLGWRKDRTGSGSGQFFLQVRDGQVQ